MPSQELQQRRGMVLGLLLGLLILCPMLALAQGQTGPNDACRNSQAIPDVTVSTSAITVIEANHSLCGAVVLNRTAQPLRCRGIRDGVPTDTLGTILGNGGILELRLDAQQGWQCVRDENATGDAVVNITYQFP